MSTIIAKQDFEELLERANPIGGGLRQLPVLLGKGFVEDIYLRGIDLRIFNCQLKEDLCVIENAETSKTIGCEFGFNISGLVNGRNTGQNFLEWGISQKEQWLTQAQLPVVKVDIHIEMTDDIGRDLMAGIEADFPQAIREHQASAEWFSEVNVITPKMRLLLDQILQCPFQGNTRLFYLEAKSLELIALKIEQLKATTTNSLLPRSLKSDDIDRVYLARDILLTNLQCPPSIIELARQVNLNDNKLKTSFKALFGTTIFGYLHHYRMEIAQQLLTEGRLNVGEVAKMVGYKSRSRFAGAFHKQFGINPKGYQINTF